MRWPPSTHGDVQDAIDVLRSMAINVKDPAYGARGDGRTDDSAAFAAAARAAKRAARTLPRELQSDAAGSVAIVVPPGDYLVRRPGALLGSERRRGKSGARAFRGAGAGISNVI